MEKWVEKYKEKTHLTHISKSIDIISKEAHTAPILKCYEKGYEVSMHRHTILEDLTVVTAVRSR